MAYREEKIWKRYRTPYSETLFHDPDIKWISQEAKERAHKSQDAQRDVWDLVDEVFEMSHRKAIVALQCALLGLKYGYPLCCVIEFIRRAHGPTKKLEPSDLGDDGRVLCPKCKSEKK